MIVDGLTAPTPRRSGSRGGRVGLAAAILIDATLIRGVLLPVAMALLGEANWYLPRRLRWLPRFAHEPVATRERIQPSLDSVT